MVKQLTTIKDNNDRGGAGEANAALVNKCP